MNKLCRISMGITAMALVFAACTEENSVPVIDTLSPTSDTIINVGNELTFSASITSDETFDYRWLVNGETKSTEALYVFTPAISGEYSIILYAENKYGSDSLVANVHVLPRVLTADFEDLSLTGTSAYWSGSDGSGNFTSGLLNFENSFDAAWSMWSGFVYSNMNDTLTGGFTNSISVYDATNGDNQFATYYDNGAKATFVNADTVQILSLKMCNNTYAALSMQNGDSFAKKFGGETGNDADYFKVTINGLNANDEIIGSVDFYLADFRSANNSEDYIISQWTEVDLSSLGRINKLSFTMESSDISGGWINTPTYFCIDDVKYYEIEK